jgi:Ca2+-transporting ATPase
MQQAIERPQAQQQAGTAWHTQDHTAILTQFQVKPEAGLDDTTAKQRLTQYGPNELVEKGGTTIAELLWEQLTNPLVLLLIAASVLSGLLGKWDSVIAISAIVILNAILGVYQEYRAEQAMAALKKMAAPMVRVRRGGKVLDIAARDLVPGDIVLLEAGSVIPADSRIVENANLQVQEASLTGESQPVEKNIVTLKDQDAPLGDRHNMLYMGTAVTYGRGVAVVVETGMKTQLGRIADLIQTVEQEKTPLQRRLAELGKVLLIAAIIVMAIAFVIGVITGQPILPPTDAIGAQSESVLLNAVAIAVAVVPEGLPAVVTVALALGAQRMLRRRALIRKLPAVETLGSVTTICSDKTGTLTENRMTVTIVDVAHKTDAITAVVDKGIAGILNANGQAEPHDRAQALLLAGNALCNDAVLEEDPEHPDKFRVIGDPTEGALVIAAAKFGIDKRHLDSAFPRVGEVPFSSERKRMTTVHHLAAGAEFRKEERYFYDLLQERGVEHLAVTKGSVDGLLEVCDRVYLDTNEIVQLDDYWRDRITKQNDDMAQNGLRVLGMAFHRWPHLPTEWTADAVEKGLVFMGMVGIIDPPRKEVKDAVAICKTAQIRPVMITGDHPLTAYAIAKELGIANEGDTVLTGHDLSKMDQKQLEDVVEKVSVYARVSPENKLNIVQALQSKGHVAAMTGDGVNDAPALKRADIGVAMGITGTAVSKEASDMVLVDDNFATIVAAVEEGRTIYDNVRRFIKYLLASNTGELFVLLASQLVSGLGLPLTTLQILWMNLITDGIPALALGVERIEKGVMKRAPYQPNESLFGRGLGRHIVIVGIIMGVTGLLLGIWAHGQYTAGVAGFQANTWNTMVFFFLTVAQMGHALGLRSHTESLFSMNFFGNRLLLGAVIVTIILQLIAVYAPFFNGIFNTTPLTGEQLLICAVLSLVVFTAVEVEKLLMRRGVLK